MLIGLIILIAVSIRFWYILHPTSLWWDTAIYVDMGKYIFSHGTLGYFESFRPPLFPILMGIFWKLGLDPVFWAKIVGIAATAGLIYYTYRIGEKVRTRAGLYAAIFLSFSPVLLYFSPIPLTDTISTFCTVLACALLLDKKYFRSGLALGCAILLRFPQGLILLPLLLTLSIPLINSRDRKKDFLEALTYTLRLGIGCGILMVPFFIYSWKMFGNPLLPIILASGFSGNHIGSPSFSYYFIHLTQENPFLVFTLIFFIWLVIHIIKTKRAIFSHTALILCVTSFLIIGAYFSHIPHKEFRYSIAFLPFFSILAGAGIALSTQKFKKSYISALIIACSILIVLVCGHQYSFYPDAEQPEFQAYNTFLQTYSSPHPENTKTIKILTTSPQLPVYSNAKIIAFFEYWEDAYDAYKKQGMAADFFAINSCNLYCKSDDCEHKKTLLLDTLELETDKLFEETTGQCIIRIFKIKKK